MVLSFRLFSVRGVQASLLIGSVSALRGPMHVLKRLRVERLLRAW